MPVQQPEPPPEMMAKSIISVAKEEEEAEEEDAVNRLVVLPSLPSPGKYHFGIST